MSKPKLVHSSVESCSANDHGDCVVLYFDGVADEDVIRVACKKLKRLPLTVDPDDEYFSFEEVSTPVSERAELHRYELSPAE